MRVDGERAGPDRGSDAAAGRSGGGQGGVQKPEGRLRGWGRNEIGGREAKIERDRNRAKNLKRETYFIKFLLPISSISFIESITIWASIVAIDFTVGILILISLKEVI
jgi:hypothetical protein